MHIGQFMGQFYQLCDLSTPGSYIDIEVTLEKDLGVWTTSNLDS